MNKVLITSAGRTATVSLNRHINKLDNVVSFHERNRQDVPFLFYSQIPEYQVLTKQHIAAEDTFATKQTALNYVAVNPYFRFAGPMLQQEFNWNVAHIVRHPRTYLESVYKRNTFTNNDILLNQLPVDSDPFAKQWNTATRFEKLCWYYANTLTFFMQTNILWYPFESLTTDPKALAKMLTNLELPVSDSSVVLEVANASKTLKNKLVSLKQSSGNITPKKLNWELLEAQELETYYSIFQPVAKHFGYVL